MLAYDASVQPVSSAEHTERTDDVINAMVAALSSRQWEKLTLIKTDIHQGPPRQPPQSPTRKVPLQQRRDEHEREKLRDAASVARPRVSLCTHAVHEEVVHDKRDRPG